MSLVLKIGVMAAALYVALALGARFLERRLMYFPDTARFNPARAGLAGVEEVVLGTPDGERVIVWSGAAQRGQPTILYFHGNGGSLESRSERIRKYMARGVGMFMMSYRGFSGSSGSPSEAANVGRRQACLRHARCQRCRSGRHHRVRRVARLGGRGAGRRRETCCGRHPRRALHVDGGARGASLSAASPLVDAGPLRDHALHRQGDGAAARSCMERRTTSCR